MFRQDRVQQQGVYEYTCLFVKPNFQCNLFDLFGFFLTTCPKGLDTNGSESHARCLPLYS